ncbi:polyprenyl synthetase family protein [Kitasatospora sp. NPDC093102]|uniref:polyprenyl synthetase family protein n=1 Tax=Kitasatospora sp. NPDC093102 TaxID=3155069 RepID=UPI003433268D
MALSTDHVVANPGEVLARAKDLAEPALRRAAAGLPAGVAEVVAHHMGWSPQPGAGASSAGDGGKAVRAALALLGARAAGAPEQCGVAGAVAVELVHNFTLLHDDIMDGDRERRHRPAAWVRFGVPRALLAGDALLALSLRVLTGARSPYAHRAAEMLTATLQDLVHGQSLDLEFTGRAHVSVDEYRTMAHGKTGSLLGCACAVGAVLAGAPSATVLHLQRFGEHLGLAFQCADDLLGIWGDPARTGKPVGSDLLAGRRTLPVLAALADPGPAGLRLAELLAAPETAAPETAAPETAAPETAAPETAGPETAAPETAGPRAAVTLAALVEQAGGRAFAEDEGRRQLAEATRHLEAAELPPEEHAELTALAATVLGRDR